MSKRHFLDLAHPMFRPVWARALATGIVGIWAVLELVRGDYFWAVLFGAAAGWMVYSFFVAFDPKDFE